MYVMHDGYDNKIAVFAKNIDMNYSNIIKRFFIHINNIHTALNKLCQIWKINIYRIKKEYTKLENLLCLKTHAVIKEQ